MERSADSLSILYKEKGKLPGLPFLDMKNFVLGESYMLSLVVAPEELLRKLNSEHRGIDQATDILSFPLSDNEGEIFLNLTLAAVEAKKFNREFDNFIGFLFIHGLFHLKGYTHGSTMGTEEKKAREKFGI